MIRFIVIVLFLRICISGFSQDVTSLLLNKDLDNVDFFIDDNYIYSLEYLYSDNILSIYTEYPNSKKKILTEKHVMEENLISSDFYNSSGDIYLTIQKTFNNELLVDEITHNITSGTNHQVKYLYENELLIEKDWNGGNTYYDYSKDSKLTHIITVLDSGKEINQEILYTGHITKISPYIDYYIPIYEVQIEEIVGGNIKTIIKSYYSEKFGLVEIETFIYEEGRVIEVKQDKKMQNEVHKLIFNYK